MKKTYKVSESWDDALYYYDIEYKPNAWEVKFLRFTYVEHYLQFVDLLNEAGYSVEE
jgi:hypothetical protein